MREWEFYRHMPVYTADGDRLGRTEEIGHAVDYVHVQQGTVLVFDWYIPIDAVDSVTTDGVTLKLNRDDLKRRGWNVPPAEFLRFQGNVPGYEYTSKVDIPEYAMTDQPEPESA